MDDILDLNKAVALFELNLEKNNFPAIPPLAARLAVDSSISMEEEFECGWVNHTINLFLAAALKFDDNGELEMGFFNHALKMAQNAVSSDANGGYLRRVPVRASGGTCYAPVFQHMAEQRQAQEESKQGFFSKIAGLFGGSENPAPKQKSRPTKAYLGMITDGDCTDPEETYEALKNVDNTFIQIIAIGTQINKARLNSFTQLPFVDVIYLPDPHKVTDELFYEKLCNNKFKAWLEAIPTNA